MYTAKKNAGITYMLSTDSVISNVGLFRIEFLPSQISLDI